MTTSARVPLQRDEKLWEAFKEDREACQRRKVKARRSSRPTRCTKCNRTMRPSKATLADYPGTVRHRSHGVCDSRGCRQVTS